MTNQSKRVISTLLLTGSLLLINCAGGKSEAISQNATPLPINTSINTRQDAVAPAIEISAPQEINLNAPLKIHWKISNPNREPIFVYSALLDKANYAFAEIEVNAARKSIEIRFTRLAKLVLEPNYFPKTAFLTIEPGKSAEGDFTSRTNLRELIKANEKTVPEKSDTLTGEWSVTAVIGFGNEIESAQKLIDNAKGKHPVDPIIEWQKLAASNALKIAVK